MITTIILLGLGSILASGILFKHQRLLTLIATAGTLWSGGWLLLTLIDRTIISGGTSEAFYLFGSFVLTIPWLFKMNAWSWPYRSSGSGKKDLVVLFVLIGVLFAAWLVQSQNGFQDGEWITHGFYNGDTMTMMTLVERSMLTDGLVKQNPFAGNGYLEYPTLWHAGLATLLKSLNLQDEWIHFLPILTYLQIFITVPMFFLGLDVFLPPAKRKEEKWLGVPSRLAVNILQTGIVLYVMAISWDNYIYPQSHFFLTGIFLLLLSLLLVAEKHNYLKKIWLIIPAAILTLVLMQSNAVTGTAAIALIITFCFWRLITRQDKKQIRLAYGVGIIFFVVIYLIWSPGNAIFGTPHFSYTAAESIMRLSPTVIALALAILITGGTQSFISLGVIVFLAMSVMTFLFSQRNIVIANAERFIYQGLLIGFPLLVLPLIRAYYWIFNKINFRTNNIREKLILIGAISATIFIVALPALISGARAHDHLMRQDKQVVTLGYREVLEYIRNNSNPNDIFLGDPNAPWALPMLTGRSMLRANYWLSPEDNVLSDVNAAFAGNERAQASSLQKADYLVINHDDINNWNLDEQKEVFRGGKISVFKTKK